MSIKSVCKNCAWYDEPVGWYGSGYCHYNPPTNDGLPQTNNYNFCHCFEASAEAISAEAESVKAALYVAEQQLANEATPSPLDWRMAQVDDSGSRFTIQGGEVIELDNRMRDASDDDIWPF